MLRYFDGDRLANDDHLIRDHSLLIEDGLIVPDAQSASSDADDAESELESAWVDADE